MTPTPGRVVVIGVGNPWRRDDGAGAAVAAAVRSRLAARRSPDLTGLADGDRELEVLELDGEAARLVEAWDGAHLVIVVDAMRSGAARGTVRLFEVDAGPVEPAGSRTSSHGLGFAQAVPLAQALGRMPRRLVVIGIEAADLRRGEGLTTKVAAAVEPAARMVIDMIDRHRADRHAPPPQPADAGTQEVA
jgi:hydrogenase maturation protease